MASTTQTSAFKSQADFRAWLMDNHDKCEGIWLRLFKKASGEATVTYAEALDEALCFGWIDGQKKSLDELSWIQKFTPRRARSGWSKRNTEHVERLTKAGLMMPAGILAVEAAKADGRWHTAYESPKNALPPEDFLKALGKDKKAKAFFETLNRANVYAIVYRLQTAKKAETRARRMAAILAMMKRGEKFH
ncbi:MAG TPA: YdeI/OmpD-associated family protein [Verrucomicrobiae bacterium]|nr:YdeI/OmpD-associated family protein [Verrucomicrobiae bacterium]